MSQPSAQPVIFQTMWLFPLKSPNPTTCILNSLSESIAYQLLPSWALWIPLVTPLTSLWYYARISYTFHLALCSQYYKVRIYYPIYTQVNESSERFRNQGHSANQWFGLDINPSLSLSKVTAFLPFVLPTKEILPPFLPWSLFSSYPNFCHVPQTCHT